MTKPFKDWSHPDLVAFAEIYAAKEDRWEEFKDKLCTMGENLETALAAEQQAREKAAARAESAETALTEARQRAVELAEKWQFLEQGLKFREVINRLGHVDHMDELAARVLADWRER